MSYIYKILLPYLGVEDILLLHSISSHCSLSTQKRDKYVTTISSTFNEDDTTTLHKTINVEDEDDSLLLNYLIQQPKKRRILCVRGMIFME